MPANTHWFTSASRRAPGALHGVMSSPPTKARSTAANLRSACDGKGVSAIDRLPGLQSAGWIGSALPKLGHCIHGKSAHFNDVYVVAIKFQNKIPLSPRDFQALIVCDQIPVQSVHLSRECPQ